MQPENGPVLFDQYAIYFWVPAIVHYSTLVVSPACGSFTCAINATGSKSRISVSSFFVWVIILFDLKDLTTIHC